MNRPILSILALLLCAAVAKADDEVRKWEGEVFAGANVSIGEDESVREFTTAIESKALAGYTLGGEFRRNLDRLPVDIGVRLAFSKIGHNVMWQANENSPKSWAHDYTNSFTVAAVGDWNFNRGGKVSPFVGVGAGVAFNKSIGANVKPFVMPRLGVGINNRLRVSVSADISDVSHNAMVLTLGYVFGVSPKVVKDKGTAPVEMPSDVRRLVRQSNVCLWTGVGALCVGLPSVVTGLTIIGMSGSDGGALLGGVITGVGGLVTLSSVPLFIVSHKKKNEALRLSLRMSALAQPSVAGFAPSAPGVGLSLAF